MTEAYSDLHNGMQVSLRVCPSGKAGEGLTEPSVVTILQSIVTPALVVELALQVPMLVVGNANADREVDWKLRKVQGLQTGFSEGRMARISTPPLGQ